MTRILMGTEAHHQLGDLSRVNPDFFAVQSETETDYIGHWLTGFGFVNVRFPKHATREMTDTEAAWLDEHPVVIT
jgi:hypothetical protein